MKGHLSLSFAKGSVDKMTPHQGMFLTDLKESITDDSETAINFFL